jgi:hypothetical protein
MKKNEINRKEGGLEAFASIRQRQMLRTWKGGVVATKMKMNTMIKGGQ